MIDAEEKTFFDKLAAEVYGEEYLPKQKIMIHPTQKTYTDACLGLVPGISNALDIGCCWGWLVRELRIMNVAAYGIDLSPHVVNQVTDWWRDYLYIGNVMDIPWADNTFDLVNARDVLEHVPPEFLRRAIAEVHRVTRWRALIVLPTLKACKLEEELEYSVPGSIFDHFVAYKPERWAALFAEFDWKRVDVPLESPIPDEKGLKEYFLYEKGAA